MATNKPRDRFYSNPGSQLAPVHAIRIDDNGHKTLVDTGEKTDIYIKIVSHMDEVDLELLLTRCQAEGYEILNKRDAISGDVTLQPKSLLEAAQILQDQENTFNQLPLETRKQFNFNFNEYIAEASKDINGWATKMGYKEKAPEPQEPKPQEPKGGEE